MLDEIKTPEDLRGYDAADLRQIAVELRSQTIKSVAITAGRLGAGLGVIELTVALPNIFDTPRDRLIWDVGHQTCPHEILTGRRDRIQTLRVGVKSVGVTAGASAPEVLVEGRRLGPVEASTLNGPDETIEFRLPPQLASVSSLPRLPTGLARPLSQG